MKDFADWLSPILVKELRQGLRTRLFLIIFLALQFFMFFCICLNLDSSNRDGTQFFFWELAGLCFLFLMPARGLWAIHSEKQANTMELLLLTQLSAWRIVWGKWLAISLQSLLIFCSILPYVIMRYFLGQIDLFNELLLIGSLLIFSFLLTALCVGVSTFLKNLLARGVMLIVGLMSLFFFQIFLGVTIMDRSPLFTQVDPLRFYLLLLFLSPCMIVLLLNIGVRTIAPPAENQASLARALTWLMVIIVCALEYFFPWEGLFLVSGFFITIPFFIYALMEQTVAIPSIYRPFVQWGFLGKLAGRFFYPGKATGLLFALPLVVIIGALFWIHRADIKNINAENWFKNIALFEGFLLPLLFINLLSPRLPRFLFYFMLQGFLCLLAIMLLALDLQQVGLIFPTTGFLLSLWHHSGGIPYALYAVVSLFVIAIGLLCLFVMSIRDWRLIGKMEQIAAQEPEQQKLSVNI